MSSVRILRARVGALSALFLCLGAVASGATAPPIQDDLVTWVEITVGLLPDEGSNDFTPVRSNLERTTFRQAVELLLQGRADDAHITAGTLGYEVVPFTDTGDGNALLFGLFPAPGSDNNRGFYFVRPQGDVVRDLVVEAPHPRNDRQTAVVAARLFRDSGARAFAMAGTHRCANTEESGCSGNTSACNTGSQTGDHPFRISDMAHTEQSFFQAFHEEVFDETADTNTLQLHGFSDRTGRPEFSFSDGTHTDLADVDHLSNALTIELEQRVAAAFGSQPAPKAGNSCNRIGDDNFKCGRVNSQSRASNGSANVCSTSASQATGNFVHMELSEQLRGLAPGDPRQPQLVIDTVLAVVPPRGPQGSISGRVWSETVANGFQEPGELGFAGVTVDLEQNGSVLASSSSDGNGNYRFEGLAADTYQVRVHAPSGFVFTARDAGTDDSVDSDVNTAGRSGDLVLGTDQQLSHVDAGLVGSCPQRELTVLLPADRVTFLEENKPTSNEGDEDEMEMDGSPSDESGLLSFSVASLPADAQVQSAELELRVTNGTSKTYFLYQMLRPWTEMGATWNQPGTGDSWGQTGARASSDRANVRLASISQRIDGSPVTATFPLNASGVALIQDWVDGTVANEGLIIPGEGQSDGMDVASNDTGTPPRLRVVYRTNTCAP